MSPDCSMDFGTPAYLAEVFRRARRKRIPMSGTFDLTYRCNFRCTHCYAAHLVGQRRSEAAELDTGQITRLLEEAADAGCLLLLLSGGEPLLRDDFVEIYTEARRLGMVVTVFTNATLIDHQHLEAFGEYPPHEVEVSLYGASAATYERVTGVPGSCRAAQEGIRRLLDAGVRVGLKSMILRENVHEIEDMAALAREWGVRYRVDPLVTARLNGDRAPCDQRVEPELAVGLEMGIERQATALARFLERQRVSSQLDIMPPERMFRCGAGQASFHVDPVGFMHPCVMSPYISCDTLSAGYVSAWAAITMAVDQAAWGDGGRCAACPTALVCGYCPGLLVLEGVSPVEPPEYLCRLGECRMQSICVSDPGVVGAITG